MNAARIIQSTGRARQMAVSVAVNDRRTSELACRTDENDRGIGGNDRGTGEYDRGTGGNERGTGEYDRGTSEYARRTAEYARRWAGLRWRGPGSGRVRAAS
ncbi:hypothetical protein GCM10027345_12320 [Hymenobacter daeguensis]